jgi:hypothetical protein
MFYDFSPDGRQTFKINLANISYIEWGRVSESVSGRSVAVHFVGTAEPLRVTATRGHAERFEQALTKFMAGSPAQSTES